MSKKKKAALDKKSVRGRSIYWKKLQSRVFDDLSMTCLFEASFDVEKTKVPVNKEPLWKENTVAMAMYFYFDSSIPFPQRLRYISQQADVLNDAMGTNYPDHLVATVLEAYGTGLYPEIESIKWYHTNIQVTQGPMSNVYNYL